jgi:hypothetical protein
VPRFRVVVPTRDRPDLLEFCLAGIAAQTFSDVEVVVSDNAVEQPARDVFDRWAGAGWRYLRQAEPVPMHDNFERACDEATGDYVAVVIDKTILHPSALEVAGACLEDAGEPVDIVTWRNDGYDPVDERRALGMGYFEAAAETAAPALYDPMAELRGRFSMASRRGMDPVQYVRGKIVFGAYSRALLDRIREHTGRLFHPLAPDYTSMVPACALAGEALDVGRPLLVSYNSTRSNGRRQGVDPVHARRFIEMADPTVIAALPIPGLYTAVDNVVAYDLVSSAARLPAGTAPELDFANLLRRAREDLAGVAWADPAERAAQYAILEAAERRAGVVPAPVEPAARLNLIGRVLGTMPAVERLALRAAGRAAPALPRATYASPVEAARAADRAYAARNA